MAFDKKGHLWKKGQSGNPNGRPKIPQNVKDFREYAKMVCGMVKFQRKVYDLAMKGDKACIQHILYYGAGKPRDEVLIEDKQGNLNMARLVVHMDKAPEKVSAGDEEAVKKLMVKDAPIARN